MFYTHRHLAARIEMYNIFFLPLSQPRDIQCNGCMFFLELTPATVFLRLRLQKCDPFLV